MLVAEVAQVGGAQFFQAREEDFLGHLDDGADETAAVAPAPGLDGAALAQVGEGFAQGHGGDAELHGQLGFAGQLLAFREQAEVDRLHQAAHYFFRTAFLAQADEGAVWRMGSSIHAVCGRERAFRWVTLRSCPVS
ncbi:hypothetical protein D9M71_718710 [compost metagenome]